MKPSTIPSLESGSVPAVSEGAANGARIPHSRSSRIARGSSGLEAVFDEPEMDMERRKDVLAKAVFRQTAGRPAGSGVHLGANPAFSPGPACRAHARNPWAIWKPSDLFAQSGPLLTLFIGVQIASACLTAGWLAEHGVLDRALLTGMLPLLFLTIDAVAFVSLRGRLLAGFAWPAVWIGLATLLPGMLALGLTGYESSHTLG